MVTKIAAELYRITQAEPGLTHRALSVANIWQEIARYQVPVDIRYVFRPGHTYAAYMSSTVPAELPGTTTKARVMLRDPNEAKEIKLVQDTIYATLKEFADRTKIKRLDILEEKVASPGMWIVVEALTASTYSATVSYFEVTCERSRITVL